MAGEYDGYFREDMFDEGQPLPSSYHRTKFESERLVRSRAEVPWRVYRPAIVVGHSRTGEMDKIDGPYYFFKPIQKVRHLLPEWVPLAGPEMGDTNIVPVDYVIAAMDHIAHQPGLDGQAFHLTNPRRMSSGDVINIFAKAGHAPQLALAHRQAAARPAAQGAALHSDETACPAPDPTPGAGRSRASRRRCSSTSRSCRASTPATPSAPWTAAASRYRNSPTTRPRSGTTGSATSIRICTVTARFPARYAARTVVITGGSSGIGKAAALQLAAAGAIPILVARSADKLEEARAEIVDAGGEAYAYSVDLSSIDAIEEFVAAAARRTTRVSTCS